MKFICQSILLGQILIFSVTSLRGTLRKLHPQKPSGCLGFFWAMAGLVAFFLIYWKAGAFTSIFPFLYHR
jgi:hypothetical protein